MNVTIVSCFFATSYGAYTDALRTAMERKLGTEVRVLASNCGCGDPIAARKEFQNSRCDYIEFPHVHYFKSPKPFRHRARNALRRLLNIHSFAILPCGPPKVKALPAFVR